MTGLSATRISARRVIPAAEVTSQWFADVVSQLHHDVRMEVAGRPVDKFLIYVTYEETIVDARPVTTLASGDVD